MSYEYREDTPAMYLELHQLMTAATDTLTALDPVPWRAAESDFVVFADTSCPLPVLFVSEDVAPIYAGVATSAQLAKLGSEKIPALSERGIDHITFTYRGLSRCLGSTAPDLVNNANLGIMARSRIFDNEFVSFAADVSQDKTGGLLSLAARNNADEQWSPLTSEECRELRRIAHVIRPIIV